MAGFVGAKHIVDAQHIALASVERVDIRVSWNFRHIVNIDRIHAFNSVNLRSQIKKRAVARPFSSQNGA
ncbi:MAG: hypothetical protein EF813_00670 [Methanosarcinales archaeon]|nr:MAG: hypothetical protein EF813_00670 [Methanosarcinales archaeon]